MNAILSMILAANIVYSLLLVQPGNPNDPGIPITGGIALLVSAAIGLGLRFFQKKKV